MSIRRLAGSLGRLFGRGAAAAESAAADAATPGRPAAAASATRKSLADAQVRSARDELLAVSRSTTIAPQVDDVLKKPVREIAQDMGFSAAEVREFGNHAFDGVGTERDANKAAQLWVAAAMKGDGEALYSLAMCFWRGIAVPQREPEKAKAIMRELGAQGHRWSNFALANMLLQEDAEDWDHQKEAFDLYLKCAESAIAPAYLNLANMYERGMGTPKDDKAALKWFSEAAKLGDPEAQMRLAYRLAHGEGVGQDNKRAFKMFEEAAGSGKAAAVYNVGCAYFLGKGVPLDYTKAADYFLQAAEAGFFPAQMNLGHMYQAGKGVPRSLDEALHWYTQASKQNSDAEPSLEALKERMRMAGGTVTLGDALSAESLVGDSTSAAGGSGGALSEGDGAAEVKQALRDVDGGVLYEKEAVRPGAETLDIKVQIDNQDDAKDLIEELQSAETSDVVMAILERHQAERKASVDSVKLESARKPERSGRKNKNKHKKRRR